MIDATLGAYLGGPGAAEPPLRVLDNPILIGQARRRLRRRQVVPALMIPALLGLCGVLFAAQEGQRHPHEAWAGLGYAALLYMGVVLFLRGTVQIAGSLGEERRSGILDFHRATPTTPWTDALGYLVGAAAREYLTAAVGLPFLLIGALGAGDKLPLTGCVAFLGVLLLTTWLYHSVAMLVGLTVDNKRGVTGAAVMAVVMLLWTAVPLHNAGFQTLAYLSPFPAAARLLALDADKLGQSVEFFGLTLHPLVFTLLVQGSVLAFLLVGVTRKLHREGATTFSRPGACAFFTLVVGLCFGGAWPWITGAGKTADELQRMGGVGLVVPVYLWTAMWVAASLMGSLAPSYLEFVRALRRARRRGLPEAAWLDDGAAAWPLAAVFSVMVLAGLGVLAFGLGGRVATSALASQATVVGALSCVAFLGLVAGATEYVRLSQRQSARSWGVLIAFVLAVLPWMLAGIISTGGAKDAALWVAALSPTFGVGAATIQMAAAWAGEPELGHSMGSMIALSLVGTTVMGGWFLFKTRSLQAQLAQKMPLGQSARRAA